jgi:hypothetical protein
MGHTVGERRLPNVAATVWMDRDAVEGLLRLPIGWGGESCAEGGASVFSRTGKRVKGPEER